MRPRRRCGVVTREDKDMREPLPHDDSLARLSDEVRQIRTILAQIDRQITLLEWLCLLMGLVLTVAVTALVFAVGRS